MIILDTNVMSALVLPRPEPRVVAWLNDQPANSVWTTVVTVYELHRGIAVMPEGRRRSQLAHHISNILAVAFRGRIALLDVLAAEEAARLWTLRRASGRPVDTEDNQIAGIARARGAAIATRDIADFGGCGVDLVNPWTD